MGNPLKQSESHTGTLGRAYVKYVTASAIAAIALLLFLGFPTRETLEQAQSLFAGTGSVGILYYTALYVIGSVLLQPCFPLTLGAGFLYGFPAGFAIALLASTLGAAAAFLTARYLARDWLARRAETDERFRAVDLAVTRDGWRVVLLLRLASVLPYNLVNYTIGMSGIGLGHFVLATWIGRIPITAVHAYLGSISPRLTSLGETVQALSPAEIAVYALGWLATLASMVYIGRLARTALAASE
ncbi:MAG: TVP38/TMEM64 family inner membrane protein YdjZ [bacterium ADurb.Bin374]|nr:MAG: TVP38/TMEM64 family inner membrane protein YdjZ [bacterium ADurb.Bin374]